jgi:hypothetical protein
VWWGPVGLRRWFSALGRCVLCALYRAWKAIVAVMPVSPLATIEIAYTITKSVQQTTTALWLVTATLSTALVVPYVLAPHYCPQPTNP